MSLEEWNNLTTIIVNGFAIIAALISTKPFFKWIWPKLRCKRYISNLLKSRNCYKCPKEKDIDFKNGGFCQWQNPASFGRSDLSDCNCFVERRK